MSIWVERLVGTPFGNGKPNAFIRHFDGIGHECQDVTDTPFPTVGTKPVRVVIEREMPIIEDDRPVLMGQAPSRLTQSRSGNSEPPAFSGLSGSRLAAIVGVSQERLLTLFDARNLLHRFPGRSGVKGDSWCADEARAEARRLLPHLRGRTVVIAGSAVAAAFGVTGKPLERVEREGVTFILLPHPSGVNRFYNSVTNCRAVRRLLRQVLGLTRPGAGQ